MEEDFNILSAMNGQLDESEVVFKRKGEWNKLLSDVNLDKAVRRIIRDRVEPKDI